MKCLTYITIFLLFISCSTYQMNYLSETESQNYLTKELNDNSSKLIIHWDDQLKTFKRNETPRHVYACKLNGTRATLIVPGTYAVIKVNNGTHQLTCKKASVVHVDENTLWRYTKPIKQRNDVVTFSIGKKQTLVAKIYHISPIITIHKLDKENRNGLTALAPTGVMATNSQIMTNYKEVSLNISQPIVMPTQGAKIQNADLNKKRKPASKSNVAADCAKYVAAKKACQYVPFGSGICMSGVNSRFSRTVVEVCSKL